MKKQSTAICILFCCLCTVCVLLTACAFIYAPSFAPVCAAACAVVAAIAATIIIRTRSYTDAVIASLSDLVSSISNLGSTPIIPEYEDSLLSKLQSQAIKLTEMLTDQNRRIESERDEIKSLISDISHQLKTPVATLRAYGELLLESDTDESKKDEYLKEFSASLEKLTFLTDSMIKLSRLESGIIVTKPSQASLNCTVLGAIKQVYRKAVQKGVEIIFDPESDDITLSHDERWTAEAIFNLLDNAVKYSKGGGTVTIKIKKYEMFARLDVTDAGIGIPPDEQAKIFTRFYRGTNTGNADGVGIGLYLARKIITDQGGYIKVCSEKGLTTFSVFLPL